MTTFTDFIVRLLLALHYYSYSCYSWLWWYFLTLLPVIVPLPSSRWKNTFVAQCVAGI